ncbi:MAG: hypothetical protein M2R45_00342 [Verrucomicrobia subdivision 3 bacterium]|nr:hypothetical protein [Limisphaerales bacterium]MCS1412900.1 hypothetical protein [Limisphaerales bacterium]
MNFLGTISAEPHSYLNLLLGEVNYLAKHGFKCIILLNGHGAIPASGRPR